MLRDSGLEMSPCDGNHHNTRQNNEEIRCTWSHLPPAQDAPPWHQSSKFGHQDENFSDKILKLLNTWINV